MRDPDPTTLVLLHGFTGSSRSWSDHLIDGLVSAGRSPVLLDLPGHGRHVGQTEPSDFTLDRVEADLEAAMSAGGPDFEPVELVGYSMGGRIALAYAARHPERVSALVLESASPGLRSEAERAARRASDAELAELLGRDGIEGFVDYWEALPMFVSRAQLPAHVREMQRELVLRNDPGSLAGALEGLGTGALPSFWDDLAGLRIPTLLIVGQEDTKFVAINREMAGLIPEATLRVVPGCGHTVHLERPDLWLEAVAGWLGGP